MTTGYRLSEPNTATTASHADPRAHRVASCALSLGGRRASMHSFLEEEPYHTSLH
ncbi:hypothetical protein Nhal_1392 [Nitrosococcus halophilus Nc 4]|uniref:Uncharacterized protein n=1 Tax=Nitrosococcus halophilus (strain Nc4) TaxID=472759 RepID=D5C0Y6_NITHN|nr:hypothetical protein Nhal_1392 [Nitrosococcus halophilus Nc 4]